MGRYRFVTLVLGWVVLVGCVTDNDEVEPKVTTAVEADVSDAGGRKCPTSSYRVLPVGASSTITVRSAKVTKSCRCQETSTSGWGCSGERCTTAYDLGHENPQVCERLAEEPVPLPKTTARALLASHSSIDPTPCTAVVVERTAFESAVVVTCPVPTDVRVDIEVEGLERARYSVLFLFNADGQCPDVARDRDAGADATDAADATNRE